MSASHGYRSSSRQPSAEGTPSALVDRFSVGMNALHAAQLGRPIMAPTVTPQGGGPSPERPLLGYILPIQADGQQHLHLFVTGDMIITESALANRAQVEEYRTQYGPGLSPVLLAASGSDPRQAVRQHITTLRRQGQTHNLRVVLRNDAPQQAQAFSQAMHAAIETSRLLCMQREQHKRDSMADFLDGISSVVAIPGQTSDAPARPRAPITTPDIPEQPVFRSAGGNVFDLSESADLDLTTLYDKLAHQHRAGQLR